MLQQTQISIRNKELSVFSGELAKPKEIAIAVKRLQVAFPDMSADFFNLLAEMIVKDKFTAERLKYAIDNVICNFKYKKLNIADIVSQDVKVKLYTMDDVYKEKGQFPHPDFSSIERNGKRFWILTTEKEMYRL